MESSLTRSLLVRAVAIVLIYVLCNALGLREYTSVISGTSPDPDGMTMITMLKAATYLLIFLAAFVVTPILLISSALILAWKHIRNRFAVKTESGTAT